MSLEHDIQQKVFRSEYQKALLNVLYTNNHLIGVVNDFFKDYSITRQQYNVMRIIRGQSPKAASTFSADAPLRIPLDALMSIQYGQPLMLAAFMQRRCRSSPLISPDAKIPACRACTPF